MTHSHKPQVIHVLKGHKAPISHLLPFGDHLVSIDEDKNLKVWQSDIAGGWWGNSCILS